MDSRFVAGEGIILINGKAKKDGPAIRMARTAEELYKQYLELKSAK
jgi:hypothetical protein